VLVALADTASIFYDESGRADEWKTSVESVNNIELSGLLVNPEDWLQQIF